MTDRIKVTITGEYDPEPESYSYPEGRDDLSVAEMAAQDMALVDEQKVGAEDVLDWIDPTTITIRLEAAGGGLRQAIVDMVNILGAPRPCPSNRCDGCDYEMQEACLSGLEALGYLRRWFEQTGETVNPSGNVCILGVQHMDPEDPLDAWEAFMQAEFGIELVPGWRD